MHGSYEGGGRVNTAVPIKERSPHLQCNGRFAAPDAQVWGELVARRGMWCYAIVIRGDVRSFCPILCDLIFMRYVMARPKRRANFLTEGFIGRRYNLITSDKVKGNTAYICGLKTSDLIRPYLRQNKCLRFCLSRPPSPSHQAKLGMWDLWEAMCVMRRFNLCGNRWRMARGAARLMDFKLVPLIWPQ